MATRAGLTSSAWTATPRSRSTIDIVRPWAPDADHESRGTERAGQAAKRRQDHGRRFDAHEIGGRQFGNRPREAARDDQSLGEGTGAVHADRLPVGAGRCPAAAALIADEARHVRFDHDGLTEAVGRHVTADCVDDAEGLVPEDPWIARRFPSTGEDADVRATEADSAHR